MPQVALLLVCVIWGSSFFSQSIGVKAVGDNPLAASYFLAVRFISATILLSLFVPRVFKSLNRKTVRDGFVLSIPFSVAFVSQVSGLQSTTPTISAFITNLSIVLTPLMGLLFFREKINNAIWVGVVVSLGGLTVLTRPWGGGVGAGELLTLICAISFTLQIHLTDIYTKRSSPLGITWMMFVCASAFFVISLVAFPQGRELLARSPVLLTKWDLLWPALYNAIFASVIAIVVLNYFQRKITPTRAALIYMTEPIHAGVFAYLFVNEEMTFWKIAGGIIIIGGNLLCELLQKRKPPPQITASASS